MLEVKEHRDPIVNVDTIEISQSAVNTWQKCHKQYDFRFNKGIKAIPGVALLEGSSHHRAVELNNLHKRKTGTDKKPKFLTDQFMTDFRARVDKEEEGVDWQGENENLIFKRAKLLHIDYMNKVAPDIEPVDVEKEFEKVITIDGVKFTLYGTPDLTTKDKRVLDYKSTGKKKSTYEVENSVQMGLYAFVHKTPNVGFIQFLKTANPEVGLVPGIRSPASIIWSLKTAATVAREIQIASETGVYAPCEPTSWVCQPRFCGYFGICRGKR